MPALKKPKYELFAHALLRDLPPMEAAKEAGFKGSQTQACKRAERSEIVDRVEELRRRRDWGGSRNVGPLIDELMSAVQQARSLGTASGFVAVRGLIVEAARLKQMLPQPQRPIPRQMTTAEWREEFGPKKNAQTSSPV